MKYVDSFLLPIARKKLRLYQQVARSIAASIAEGRYVPGDRLPSERGLADSFGVSAARAVR